MNLKSLSALTKGLLYLSQGVVFSLVLPALAVAAGPAAPTLKTPANSTVPISPTNVSFSWSAIGPGATYRIVISQNSGFTGFNDTNATSTCDSTCFTTTNVTVNGATVTFSKSMELSGWTYYWKVRANNSTGATWTWPSLFTTTGVSKVWPIAAHSNIPFGLARVNNNKYHTGIDIMTPLNTPVHAMCKGTVILNNTNRNYGNAFENYWSSFLIIKHDCDSKIIYGYYGHLSSSLAANASIKANDVIGTIRMAKNQNGTDWPANNHLHFGLNTNYLSVNWGYAPSYPVSNPLSYVLSLGWINPISYLP